MKYLTIALSALLLLPSHAVADVNDIVKMRQLRTGDFQVNCLNGSVETVSAANIIQDNVCRKSTPTLGLICTGDNFHDNYNITRISDGYKFGSTEFGKQVTFDQCLSSIKEMR